MTTLPPHIGLLVSGKEALTDYNLFVATLELWHPDAVLYVFTDSETPVTRKPKYGTLHIKQSALDTYKGKRRAEMEATPGRVYDSLFKEYTYEKANVLEWMFEVQPDLRIRGAWFMDADIVHTAPLVQIPPESILVLSPHYIRLGDQAKFGRYNAGYLMMKDPAILDVWRSAGHKSRFFEQAALEDIAIKYSGVLYELPASVNFGWWRMYQASVAPPEQQKKFSIYRPHPGIGLQFEGLPLQSIHTHWYQKDGSATEAFNMWFLHILGILKRHPPAQQFLRILQAKPS
jgi:hypothetical protein